jgi:hypothetical protein
VPQERGERHDTHVATSLASLTSRTHQRSTVCTHARRTSPVVHAACSGSAGPLFLPQRAAAAQALVSHRRKRQRGGTELAGSRYCQSMLGQRAARIVRATRHCLLLRCARIVVLGFVAVRSPSSHHLYIVISTISATTRRGSGCGCLVLCSVRK